MEPILGTRKMVQICAIVKDVETAKRKWAEFLGADVPETANAGPYEITEAQYLGKPEKKANCLMASFDLTEDISFEVLQPTGGVPSEWQNFLNERGEGIHHFAFGVKDTEALLKKAEAAGYGCTQKGKYNNASGMYAYLDTVPKLKATIEALESF